jgi:hypothetical protein
MPQSLNGTRRGFFLRFSAVLILFPFLLHSAASGQIPSGGTSLDAVLRELNSKKADNGSPVTAGNKITNKVHHCKPGPWGALQYYYIYLEAPESLVERFPMPTSVSRWCFPNWTKEQMLALFAKAGLTQTFQDTLISKDHLMCEDGVLCVFPPFENLESMTQEQREAIYSQLALFEQNEYHKSPVFITSNDVDDWLRGTSIRPELAAKLKKFIYKRGDSLVFSDVQALLSQVRNDDEARSFFKLMTRTRSLIARLDLEDEKDLKAITAYWTGPSERNKDILPMLESVASTEGPSRIDIAHLMPALPRKTLYTYPSADMAMLGRIPDCHWTSLNFFNYFAKDYFLNTRLAADHLLTHYDKVDTADHFGDVLMFMEGDNGSAIHSCVFIADDIVYTKNGDNLVTPWVLMKLDDVKKIYFTGSGGSIQAYRWKATAGK